MSSMFICAPDNRNSRITDMLKTREMFQLTTKRKMNYKESIIIGIE